MYVNIREWRLQIPWTQAELYAKTVQLGRPVTTSTISSAEAGNPIKQAKAQALLNALNAGLMEKGLIESPLTFKDIQELQIA